VLHLENNRLESLPDNLGDLPSLTKLAISTNCLRFLPGSMGRLKKIQRIDAANNMLVGGFTPLRKLLV
jgi:Leucine-rich repeat (LRR) protein